MRVRVLTLNVLNLEGDPRRQEILNSELRRLQPDLVSLQEVVRDGDRDQLKILLDGTELFGSHQADSLAHPMPWASRFGGTAIATRWRHRVVETLDPRARADVLQPWCTLAAVVDVPGEGELLFIATTLSASFEGATAHEREVVALTDLDLRHRRPLPTVIAGDFNVRPESSTVRYLTGLQSLSGRSVYYHDAWAAAGDGPGHTWTAENPLAGPLMDVIVRQPGLRWRIDYVFIGSVPAHPNTRCRIQSASLAFDKPVDGQWPSDHFGVLVDVELGTDLQSAAAVESLMAGSPPWAHAGTE